MRVRPDKKCHPLLIPIKTVVGMLEVVLGPDYEIVLHDVSDGQHFIVAMANETLTGRSMESHLTDFGEYVLTSERFKESDFIANYPSFAPDGKPMRSSVAIVRDEDHRIVGFLCVNYDLTRALLLKDLAGFLTAVTPLDAPEAEPERFAPHPDDQIKAMMEEVKRGRRGVPLNFATKQERTELLDKLDRAGFFDMKGALETLCEEMGKSRFTIYGDLRTIRLTRDRRG